MYKFIAGGSSELLLCFYQYFSLFPLYYSFLRIGDYKEVVAVELIGGFDEGGEFAFAGFLGGHVVADLDQLLYLCAFAGNEVYLFVVASTVIEQCLTGNINQRRNNSTNTWLSKQATKIFKLRLNAVLCTNRCQRHTPFLGLWSMQFQLVN